MLSRGNRAALSIMTMLLGVIGLVSVIAIDAFVLPRRDLEASPPSPSIDNLKRLFLVGEPNFSAIYLVSSGILLISLAALFGGVSIGTRPPPRLMLPGRFSVERVGIAGALLIALMSLLLLLIWPLQFNAIATEDGPIEWGSALLLFGASLTFIFSFVRCRDRSERLTTILMAAVLFVLAMEEISWFQRVIGFETPDIFAANVQEETNLHNFYTHQAEIIFYFGSYLFLVILPFIRVMFPSVLRNSWLRTFVPYPYIAVIGAVVCSYNYDMWNIIFLQATFWSSLIILLLLALLCRDRGEKRLLIATIASIVVSQALFLLSGDRFSFIHVIKEYKELLIPLGLLVYAASIYRLMTKRRYEPSNIV